MLLSLFLQYAAIVAVAVKGSAPVGSGIHRYDLLYQILYLVYQVPVGSKSDLPLTGLVIFLFIEEKKNGIGCEIEYFTLRTDDDLDHLQ